ncbi:MAG: DUF2630 family protein [Acidimicrobiales bacterium]
MDDHDIVTRIDNLVAEEHELRGHAGGGRPLTNDERSRLDDLEVKLDQLWDLLRQRRARREMGENPDAAHLRPPETVEHYQQ